MKTSISFLEAAQILEQDKHCPFLCTIREAADNVLYIEICSSEIDADKGVTEFSGDAALDEILKQCTPIEPNQNRKFELIFEDYIIYQVRNESYCSYDPSEIRVGKYLIIFEKSNLLDFLSISTNAHQFDDGYFFPYQWRHYGVYTQNHVIDIVSHAEPQVYKYD